MVLVSASCLLFSATSDRLPRFAAQAGEEPVNPVLNVIVDQPPGDAARSHCLISATSNCSPVPATAIVPMLPPDFRGRLRLLQGELLRAAPLSRRANPEPAQKPVTMLQAVQKTVMLRKTAPAAPSVDTSSEVGAVAPPEEQMTERPAGGSFGSSAANRMLEEIGSQLHEFLFSGIQGLLNESVSEATALGKPLLIRLCVKHPGLSSIPWEALYDAKNRRYVTTNDYTPLTRRVDPDLSRVVLPIKPPLRILAMASRARSMANGTQMGAIGVDEELDGIVEALAKLIKKKTVRLGKVPSAQARSLNLSVLKGYVDEDSGDDEQAESWNIFHFIGHGGYDENRKMGYIVVQQQGGAMGAPLYSSDLQQILIRPGKTPTLVVLNSCSGAAERGGRLFSSVAAELVQAGIPAVLAMQFEISEPLAQDFAKLFYTYLSEGISIQAALTNTRRVLQVDGISEWIAPVLYMQSPDGLVFTTVVAPPAAPAQSG